MDVSNFNRQEKKDYELELIDKLVSERAGLVQTSEILELGIDYRRILQFVEEGYLIRVKSGYYKTKYFEFGSEEELILRLFPDAVLTMETALYYYGYLQQRPYVWHLAITKNCSKSRFKIDYPNVQPYYTENEVLTRGVKELPFAGGTMQIYTKERLVCDCLKYQEKMDREDFKKALLTYIQDEEKDVAALMEFARERKVLGKVQSMIGIWL